MLDSTPALPTLKSPPCDGEPALSCGLGGHVIGARELGIGERRRMWTLLDAHFADSSFERFERDLAEKQWVVVVTDSGGEIQGFSTLQRLEVSLEGERLVVYFSGDTIVARDFRGVPHLERLWSRHVFALAANEEARTYWFLICSGYKTYRFLPVFFREFYPRWDRPTPQRIHRALDLLGGLKFPDEYDPTSGIVRFRNPTPLRRGVAELTAKRRTDPHVAFFAAVNPGHVRGDELACLTEIHLDNATPALRRVLGLPRGRRP